MRRGNNTSGGVPTDFITDSARGVGGARCFPLSASVQPCCRLLAVNGYGRVQDAPVSSNAIVWDALAAVSPRSLERCSRGGGNGAASALASALVWNQMRCHPFIFYAGTAPHPRRRIDAELKGLCAVACVLAAAIAHRPCGRGDVVIFLGGEVTYVVGTFLA
eukprot:gene3828-biopygen5297